jgi:hypothetical protein
MRRIGTLLGIGAAVGLLAATLNCTDRSEEIVDRKAVCDRYCATEERCAPGASSDFWNEFDEPACLDSCRNSAEWERDECVEEMTTSFECMAALSCEAWITTMTVGDEDVRSCSEERILRTACRGRHSFGDGS